MSFATSLEIEALDSFVPIIRKEMQSFLKLLLAMQKPQRILEVGTAVGFSAILMAEYDPYPCEIVTIEIYEKRKEETDEGLFVVRVSDFICNYESFVFVCD